MLFCLFFEIPLLVFFVESIPGRGFCDPDLRKNGFYCARIPCSAACSAAERTERFPERFCSVAGFKLGSFF